MEDTKVSEPKWTKGPWRAVNLNGPKVKPRWGIVSNSDELGEIAEVRLGGEANARLIAAAPDLYEALQAMVEFYAADCEADCKVEEHGPAGQARAALAKARGDDQ